MKKRLIIFLIGLLCFTACSTKKADKPSSDNGNGQPDSSQSTQTGDNTQEQDPNQAESKNKDFTEADFQKLTTSIGLKSGNDGKNTIVTIYYKNDSQKDYYIGTATVTGKENGKEVGKATNKVDYTIKAGSSKAIDFTLDIAYSRNTTIGDKMSIEYIWEVVD